jgi:hypothetical protein
VRLETELRRRLEEIEAQADELRRSRRRLVTAALPGAPGRMLMRSNAAAMRR